jgi:4'-phosphopantetheinyl transferase
MQVYWLEQSEKDIPDEIDWLGESEASFLSGLRFAPRRASWRLGRLTAKRAVAAYLHWPDSFSALAKIEIRPAASGAPEVFFDGQPAAISISLSHRNGQALCAVASGAIELGCDLELIEPRSDGFIGDYFTAEEQALIARQPAAVRPRVLALLWSAKESALKALHTGLRLDTRSVAIDPLEKSCDLDEWTPLIARHAGEKVLHGWWQAAGNMVRTIVATPPPAPPIPLQIAANISEESPRNAASALLLEWKRI